MGPAYMEKVSEFCSSSGAYGVTVSEGMDGQQKTCELIFNATADTQQAISAELQQLLAELSADFPEYAFSASVLVS